jgi:response regulator RpfG family c-di-GMP phosphodiesterase
MKKLKVLIADDELMLQEIYSMVLETDFCCDFTFVANGNDAISALKNDGPFDLILCDYKMPEANGGKVYIFNKNLHNTPFFLFSGGFLQDYCEFYDFTQSNPLNRFFGKPFSETELLHAVKNCTSVSHADLSTDRFIKVNLRHYLNYTDSAAEVYIKLAEDKFTKIIDTNSENVPEKDLLIHYLDKGIEFIFIDKIYFSSLMKDIFNHLQEKVLAERKKETSIDFCGMPFKVCFEGLNEIGISNFEIDRANDLIRNTVSAILSDAETKERFRSYCSQQGYAIGHSLLIMYIAACICHHSGLNFQNSMSKICTAAFFHDFSLFETDAKEDFLNLEEAPHSDALFNHPILSAGFLPDSLDIFDDTAKIITEHHEKPKGNGYPKKLNANTIAPLSCLFILSQQICFNIIRNDFEKDRLNDFLKNIKNEYSEGNFAKFYKSSEAIFLQGT